MEFNHVLFTLVIITGYATTKYVQAYVLNIEICLKLIYNLDWDYEGSLEKYHYCHALAQTLGKAEQVIYKMQIKDHMEDAWLDLVKKRGADYSLSRLATARARGMVSEDASDSWRDLIRNHVRKPDDTDNENQYQQLINNDKSVAKTGYDLMSEEVSWVPILLVAGCLLYVVLGVIIIVAHHYKTRDSDKDECVKFLCDDESDPVTNTEQVQR